jgi:excisionase family DNA binding protein
MLRLPSPNRNGANNVEVASPEPLRKIGSMDVYKGADADEVLKRLRNMSFGRTNSRVSKLRQNNERTDVIPASYGTKAHRSSPTGTCMTEDHRSTKPPVAMTTAEAAAFLGLSVQWVTRRAQAGTIPVHRGSGKYQFFEDELVDWLRSAPMHSGARWQWA